jgi:hypothetical protein
VNNGFTALVYWEVLLCSACGFWGGKESACVKVDAKHVAKHKKHGDKEDVQGPGEHDEPIFSGEALLSEVELSHFPLEFGFWVCESSYGEGLNPRSSHVPEDAPPDFSREVSA